MGKKKDLTPRKKQITKTLLHENYTYREVAAKCELEYGFAASLCSISRISKEPLFAGQSNRVGKCGKHRLLNRRYVRDLRRLARQNRRLPSRRLALLFSEQTGITVSRNIVIRELYRSGVRRIKPKMKPLLSAKTRSSAWSSRLNTSSGTTNGTEWSFPTKRSLTCSAVTEAVGCDRFVLALRSLRRSKVPDRSYFEDLVSQDRPGYHRPSGWVNAGKDAAGQESTWVVHWLLKFLWIALASTANAQ